MYTIQKKEVLTIKNYYGRPRYGYETRWDVLRDGKKIMEDSHGWFDGNGIYFSRKKDAAQEIEQLMKKELAIQVNMYYNLKCKELMHLQYRRKKNDGREYVGRAGGMFQCFR